MHSGKKSVCGSVNQKITTYFESESANPTEQPKFREDYSVPRNLASGMISCRYCTNGNSSAFR